MRYNERIREIREDNSLTQQKVADLLHVGQRTYADYESGKTRIPVDSLLILARYYNVSVDYISGASNVKTKYPQKVKKRNVDFRHLHSFYDFPYKQQMQGIKQVEKILELHPSSLSAVHIHRYHRQQSV